MRLAKWATNRELSVDWTACLCCVLAIMIDGGQQEALEELKGLEKRQQGKGGERCLPLRQATKRATECGEINSLMR